MRIQSLLLISAAMVFTALAGCGDSATDPVDDPKETSTFETLRVEFLAKRCATSGCHAGPTPAAGLSMEASVAYANLVNAVPSNHMAAGEGMKRVLPGSPTQSFLYRKILGDLQTGHGERMPMGSAALSANTIEFVRQWIAAGAPQTGVVADAGLLEGSGEEFIPLPPPEKGFQIKMKPFQIDAGDEREVFYFMRSPNASPILVNKFQVRMRDNSHHFIMYAYPKNAPMVPPVNTFREQNGDMEMYAAYRQFFLGSQTSDFTFEFPAGVALPLAANAGLDMNSHYVNGTDAPINGEVYVNLHTTDKAQRLARELLWSDDSFVLLPYKTTVVEGYIPADENLDVFMLSSHTHRRGKSFKIYIDGGPRNGELVYENSNWHTPPVKAFNPPLRLNEGEGLRYVSTYYNESEFPVRFGLTSDDEMCIVVGYYAPAL